jgi:Fe-S-cluster containining protein
VRDGPLLRVVKRAALATYRANRLLAGLRRGRPAHVLAGACARTGGCCEAPAIRVLPLAWHLPTLRAWIVGWNRLVNGFALQAEAPRERLLVFRCTHFEHTKRECDSYDSRPGMCRDYPRGLLEQPAPQLLPGCGFRPVARNALALRAEIERRGLAPEVIERLNRDLRLL